MPVICHVDERADVEGDGGMHYFQLDQIPYRFPRTVYPWLLKHWDGGPAKVADTVEEGDEIAGFVVKHFPGHAPGLIGLWRESDRLAIVSDTIYFVDSMKFKPVDWPNVPNRVFNQDHDAAIASVRKLAALEPRTVAAGHSEPIDRRARGDADAARAGRDPRLALSVSPRLTFSQSLRDPVAAVGPTLSLPPPQTDPVATAAAHVDPVLAAAAVDLVGPPPPADWSLPPPPLSLVRAAAALDLVVPAVAADLVLPAVCRPGSRRRLARVIRSLPPRPRIGRSPACR